MHRQRLIGVILRKDKFMSSVAALVAGDSLNKKFT